MAAPLGKDTSPRNAKEIAFCQAYLKHYSAEQAWREAGYSAKRHGWGTKAKRLVARFAPYLEPMVAERSKAVAVRHAVSLDDVMEEMRSVAFVNPDDYYTVVAGKLKQRPWDELTREQKAACEITRDMFGKITGYRLPAIKVKGDYLHRLGQQLGGFLPAAIQERAAAKHSHLHLHLDNVPTEELEQLEKQLLALCPPETAKALGITVEGEFSEVSNANAT